MSLWQDGLNAKLSVNSRAGEAWINLQVGLGEAHSQVAQVPGHVRVPGPSRLRRRQRRADSRQRHAAEKADGNDEPVAVQIASTEKVDVVCDVLADTVIDTKDAAAEQAGEVVQDEICTDAEYAGKPSELIEKVKTFGKKMCSVEFYPEHNDNIHEFKEIVENYFKKRIDVIEKVIDCKIEDCGRRVKMRSIVKIRFGWTSFFNDPKRNFSDLIGLRTVRHGCGNLSQCDPAPD